MLRNTLKVQQQLIHPGRKFISMDQLRAKYDVSQTGQLDDSLTEVDTQDQVLGPLNKLEAHLRKGGRMENPHRAFSLFLFNHKNELLLQQRSLKKITFPNLWTNTVCSHPVHTPEELDTTDGIGARRAAVRRAQFEMNIHDLNLDKLHCGSRILYYAPADETFAEYELDYIVFAKQDVQAFKVNPDEVKDTRYVSIEQLDTFLDERREKFDEDITPWFKLLKERKLMSWWETLLRDGKFPREADQIESFIVQ